ncbi:DoxX family protein [Ferruginibacter albus]|uniref:DoxX family protein n=1 Tax=Ferruginibacter albus TaxID=2875540 RepID=UPI001CC7925B|nr:hypothetical protein [Ferruginibacter albus]UAY52832.1 hypothetical protein K9M53_03925 [Ferruginibacter albus]
MKTNSFQNLLRIALGLFMIFAGVSHLTCQRQEFQTQVPKWLSTDTSFIDFIVMSSGLVEIILGLSMLFFVKHQMKVGIALAIFYVFVFPGNISQYTNKINAFGLNTDQKRFIRLFFQPILIFCALWSTGSLFTKLKKDKARILNS